jgi:L-iditol 2-dehydrogenase
MADMLAYTFNKGKTSPDERLRLEKRPVPVLGGDGAVIRVEACSVCGTDVRTYRFGGDKIDDRRIIGHEIVGTITEAAPGLPGGLRAGDRVGLAPAIGCGECFSCKKGRTNMCDNLSTIGFQYDGGFAEYMVLPKQSFLMGNVYALPPAEDPAIFALSEPLACVINAQSFLDIQPGEDVVIFGSGIIGCFHAEMALAEGASVFIVETAEERIRQVRDLLKGVQFISGGDTVVQDIRARTGGKGADVAIIACSVGAAQSNGLHSLAKGGRISLFGGLPGDSAGFLDSNLIHYRELGVFGVHASTPAQNRTAMEIFHSGRIDGTKYISRRYPLGDVERAFRDAAEGVILKAVVCMD